MPLEKDRGKVWRGMTLIQKPINRQSIETRGKEVSSTIMLCGLQTINGISSRFRSTYIAGKGSANKFMFFFLLQTFID